MPKWILTKRGLLLIGVLPVVWICAGCLGDRASSTSQTCSSPEGFEATNANANAPLLGAPDFYLERAWQYIDEGYVRDKGKFKHSDLRLDSVSYRREGTRVQVSFYITASFETNSNGGVACKLLKIDMEPGGRFAACYVGDLSEGPFAPSKQSSTSQLEPPERWYNRMTTLESGTSEKEVRKVMQPYAELKAEVLIKSWHERLGFLTEPRMEAWVVAQEEVGGTVVDVCVLAVFSPEGHLEDLLSFQPRMYLKPLIAGTYDKKLRSIQKGMSLNEVFMQVGEQIPGSYYKNEDGKWIVMFDYPGNGPDAWIYEVDAGIGVVVGVWQSDI